MPLVDLAWIVAGLLWSGPLFSLGFGCLVFGFPKVGVRLVAAPVTFRVSPAGRPAS